VGDTIINPHQVMGFCHSHHGPVKAMLHAGTHKAAGNFKQEN
jgi:hypothetical protein